LAGGNGGRRFGPTRSDRSADCSAPGPSGQAIMPIATKAPPGRRGRKTFSWHHHNPIPHHPPCRMLLQARRVYRYTKGCDHSPTVRRQTESPVRQDEASRTLDSS
jgi:hypothetical protein